MIDVRPTLNVLKSLEKSDMLPLSTVRAMKHIRSVDDRNARLELFATLGLSSLDIPLLDDARQRFTSDGAPDRHVAASRAAKRTIYEARDRTRGGWRGALTIPDDDDTAWLVHIDAHDRFHSTAATSVAEMARTGSLGPSELDLRIRALDRESSRIPRERASLLEAFIDALHESSRTNAPQRVVTRGYFLKAELTVEVTTPIDSDWESTEAHHHTGDVIVRIDFASTTTEIRDELLRTCIPFLQPDQNMWEALYRAELVVQVLLTRAKLMQLLATDLPALPVEDHTPPAPEVLHYSAKVSLTEAYVSGRAVRAVCGQWWVPVGDDITHSELPICPDCESEAPFAQIIRQRLRAVRAPEPD